MASLIVQNGSECRYPIYQLLNIVLNFPLKIIIEFRNEQLMKNSGPEQKHASPAFMIATTILHNWSIGFIRMRRFWGFMKISSCKRQITSTLVKSSQRELACQSREEQWYLRPQWKNQLAGSATNHDDQMSPAIKDSICPSDKYINYNLQKKVKKKTKKSPKMATR